MVNKEVGIVALVAVLVGVGAMSYSHFLVSGDTVSLSQPHVRGLSDVKVVVDRVQPVHPPHEFDEQLFLEGLNRLESYGASSHLVGGVIPHHMLPSHLISGFFEAIAKQNPKTIILIGPNHRELGESKVITSRYNWQGRDGVVLTNQHIVNRLLDSGEVSVDDEAISKEHSISSIVPFIDHHLPDVTVVPLILKHAMSEDEVTNLAQQLNRFVGGDTVIVAPVDFSHFLSAEQAAEKDQESLAAIKDFDTRKILSFGNDHLDSPPAIVTLLDVMKSQGASNLAVLDNTNSGFLYENYIAPVTSYFVLAFTRP